MLKFVKHFFRSKSYHFTYFLRAANFEYINEVSSDSIVVFIHGILSKSAPAFKLHGKNEHFWDQLTTDDMFTGMDIAHYSYGATDLSYILEQKTPISNLRRLSIELHGYLSEYKNVLFIAHSQGGLLAKNYASLFHDSQGIHLLTLHTPHHNTSIAVMKYNEEDLWDSYASYCVPHIFCASINDNKIVKPDNAHYSCRDKKYLSKDKSKKKLGHSHLSSCPDDELIDLYCEEIFHYRNSGFSYSYPEHTEILADETYADVHIIFSRSGVILDKRKHLHKDGSLVQTPWKELISNDRFSSTIMTQNFLSKNKPIIFFKGCSTNYFRKYISRDHNARIIHDDIDENTPRTTNAVLVEELCDLSMISKIVGPNPYQDILFDPSDFKKGTLIDFPDFMAEFVNQLRAIKFTMRNALQHGSYRRLLRLHYENTAKILRRRLSEEIFSECVLPSRRFCGPVRFDQFLAEAISTINGMPKRNDYKDIYKIFKTVFIKYSTQFGTREIEVVISKLMRSDGDLFWIDKQVRQLYDPSKFNDIFHILHSHNYDDVY